MITLFHFPVQRYYILTPRIFCFRRTLNMFRVKDKESSGVLSSYLGHWLCPECVFF